MESRQDRILLVDDNRLILRMVERNLKENQFDVSLAENPEQALGMLNAALPDLIVSDVMMPGMDGYEFCRRLKTDPRTARIPVIMLTANAGIKEKIKGFSAGADDYLVKPVERQELVLRIRALLARVRASGIPKEEQKPQHHIISVFSLRGGCGKSTMSVNLAVSLAQMWSIPVALADMAFESNHDAMLLNLRPKRTWADLGALNLDLIDDPVVYGHLAPSEVGVHVLPGPDSPISVGLITAKLVGHVSLLLRERFEYTIADLPSTFSETNLAVLDLSDLIILVITPELAGLKVTRATLEVFDSLGYSRDRVSTVLNWTFPKRGLPQKDIEAALGMSIDLVVPYEQVVFVDGIQHGVPAVLSAPKADGPLAIQKYAYHVSEDSMAGHAEVAASEMMLRVKAALGRSGR
jgi:pilus assembly protein CpaE